MFDAVGITTMGYSVRSATIRYTEWRSWQNASLTGDWSEAGLIGAELYPHIHDPRLLPTDFDSSENINLAADAMYAEARKALAAALRQSFDGGGGSVQ